LEAASLTLAIPKTSMAPKANFFILFVSFGCLRNYLFQTTLSALPPETIRAVDPTLQ
jgi:hypothetical protein